MKKTLAAVAFALFAVTSLVLVLRSRREARDDASTFAAATTGEDRSGTGAAVPGEGRSSAASVVSTSVETTSEIAALSAAPRSPEELRALVTWMRGLPREELLRLTNAEFKFNQSPLVEMLQGLEGDWVVGELGRLAVGENEVLVKATLIVGLYGGFSFERIEDPQFLVTIGELAPQLARGSDDPFHVAATAVLGAMGASLRQKSDLSALLLPHLAQADNPALLINGYLAIGQRPGADDELSRVLVEHASPDGRMGALEGLRSAGTKQRLSPEDITRLGSQALANETSARNQVLLVEMMASRGGEAGLEELGKLVDQGGQLSGPAATMLAIKLEPGRATEKLEAALARPDLSDKQRGELYRALGAVAGPESGQRLLGVVQDPKTSDTERLQALQGLWNRPMEGELARELQDLVQGDSPAALRAESLRMLAQSPDSGVAIDARELATNDDDPEVRKEAVVFAALQGEGDDGWLEERLLQDSSPDVKAAALGAMVMKAHYQGAGEGVLGHLSRARKLIDDPATQKMIDEGEKLVRSYDPRRVDLELAEEASLYETIAPLAQGPARQEMKRRAALMQRMLVALGGPKK